MRIEPQDIEPLSGSARLWAGLRHRIAALGLVRARRAWGLLPVALATGVVLWHVAPAAILHDTTTVGGDLVAHSYLVRQLRESLTTHGRIISWAPGWWGGFPLFQYYFPLPYLWMVALGTFLPHNVAFKIGAVSALIATPVCAAWFGRLARLPRPLPVLLAVFCVPLLLDTTHTMWGVNAYSTLAGMIANSYGFALMLPALGMAMRDARRGRAHPVTAVLFAAVILSHFFTALMLAVAVVMLPLLPGLRFRSALRALLPSGLLALLLCAGWLVPLILKRPWSVDFGVNWTVHPWRNLPRFLRWAGPAAVLVLVVHASRWRRQAPAVRRFAVWMLALLAVAAVLFRYGYDHLSPVFVNIRFWPFIVGYALALAAVAAACLLRWFPRPNTAVWGVSLAVLALAWDAPNHARDWARHNFRGLEAIPEAREVFERLIDPLDQTPGRLAYDLHPDNERIGSSRVFELTPFRIDKPILEGGLVNSALGALPAYVVQGWISDDTAGFPPIVRPQSFDLETATPHLAWLNVRHFLARSARTRAALEDSIHWRRIGDAGAWSLYETRLPTGPVVRVLDRAPTPVRTDRMQADLLEWMYRPAALAEPFVFLPPGMPAPPRGPAPIDRARYRQRLDRLDEAVRPDPAVLWDTAPIAWEETSPGRLRFHTTAPGRPHVIAQTWFPNWQAHGADGPYPLTPCLMLVYPRQTEVELRYADLAVDRAARGLATAGWMLLPVWMLLRRRR